MTQTSLIGFVFAVGLGGLFLGGGCSTAEPTPADQEPADAGASSGATGSSSGTLGAGALQVIAQDLSVLLPLPQSAAEIQLLHTGITEAAHGALLPSAAYAALTAPLDPRTELGQGGPEPREAMRMVGLRLDPCFKFGTSTVCQPQLRGIFQVLHADGSAADGALHVFYDLPADEYRNAVRQMVQLRGSRLTQDEALGVHPLVQQEGLAGAYAQGLRSIVLEHAGAQRVRRVTFVQRTGSRQSEWIFGILEKSEETFELKKISTMDSDMQTLVAGLAAGNALLGTIAPSTIHHDDLTLLLDTEAARSAPLERQHAAFDAALSIENPLRHSADSIDCASCHVAAAARSVAESSLGLSDDRGVGYPDAPALQAPVQKSLENIHAFSWLGREAGVNQRVANETREAVKATLQLLTEE